jgi:hypothetical protein
VRNEIDVTLRKYAPSEFVKIMASEGTLEERLTANYLNALEPDIFNCYVYKPEPVKPYGWQEAYELYKTTSEKLKSEAWRSLESKFSGYLKNVREIQSQNDSNLNFLHEMLSHFEKLGMKSNAEKVRNRIGQFRMISHAA